MSWYHPQKMSDLQAQQLKDQLLAAYDDTSPEAARNFVELTTLALLYMSDEQYAAMREELRDRP